MNTENDIYFDETPEEENDGFNAEARVETMRALLDHIFAEGSEPMTIARRVLVLAWVYRRELVNNADQKQMARILGKTRTAFSNYIKQQLRDPFDRVVYAAEILPPQEGGEERGRQANLRKERRQTAELKRSKRTPDSADNSIIKWLESIAEAVAADGETNKDISAIDLVAITDKHAVLTPNASHLDAKLKAKILYKKIWSMLKNIKRINAGKYIIYGSKKTGKFKFKSQNEPIK